MASTAINAHMSLKMLDIRITPSRTYPVAHTPALPPSVLDATIDALERPSRSILTETHAAPLILDGPFCILYWVICDTE